MTSARLCLPLYVTGKVVKGFGRGSKELGIPTANFPEDIVENVSQDINCGIYFGWAKVNHGPVYKMVMSVGWNPYYMNIKKSMETHILHDFKEDFYGALLKVVLLGYIRPEKNFNSLDDLITEIKLDIQKADTELNETKYNSYKEDIFFKDNGISSYTNKNGSH